MNTVHLIGRASFLIGLVLLIFGILATQTTGEQVIGEVTGHFSDTTMWYIIGGVLLMVAGVGLARAKKK